MRAAGSLGTGPDLQDRQGAVGSTAEVVSALPAIQTECRRIESNRAPVVEHPSGQTVTGLRLRFPASPVCRSYLVLNVGSLLMLLFLCSVRGGYFWAVSAFTLYWSLWKVAPRQPGDPAASLPLGW